ncbi:hypothetical protein BMBphi_gp027 [Bacillus phage vB_BthS_BMBphi]|nr:hypothetical protein BMBphi_gp027 [Bacillus phage vB_BthS_BMBphi]
MNLTDGLSVVIEYMSISSEEVKALEYDKLNGKQRIEVRKNWKACPLSKWNATTVRSYLQCLTQHRFKMDYISDNIRQENAIISQFIKQYGREVLKEFIRDCVKDYTPTQKYPIVTFGFMYTYQRKHILPAIIKKRQAQEERLKELEAQKEMDFVDYTEVF